MLDPELIADLRAVADGTDNGGAPKPDTDTQPWVPVDLGPVLRGEVTEPAPSILPRADGVAILYPGKYHSLAAEPEAGKSTLAAEAARGEMTAGHKVLVVDFETSPAEIVTRLLDVGAAAEDIAERVAYLNPDQPLTETAWAELVPHLDGVTLAWIDGVTEAMKLHKLSYADNDDIAAWQDLLPRRLKRRGVAVLELDHVTKAADSRGRWAIGGQHKMAGVDVAMTLKAAKPFSRGVSGESVLRVEKDRPGHLRKQAAPDRKTLARVVFEAVADERLDVKLEAPDGTAETFRPTYLMEQVSRAVEAHPGATKNTVRAMVNGKTQAKDLALALLIEEGHVGVEISGQAHLHKSVKPYREGDDG